MFNTIQVICSSEKDRLILAGIFRNLGADAVFSNDLNDALSIFEKARPAAVFIADGGEPPAEIQLRELRRAAPFIPLIPLLKRRDASRAVDLMKAGALDCAQSPWTEEELRPLYRKALNLGGTVLELDSFALRRRRRSLALALAAAFGFAGFAGGLYYGFHKFSPHAPPPDSFHLPYSHPSGIVIKKDSVLISDWYSQALYEHGGKNFGIRRVTSLPDLTPVAMTASQDALWLTGTNGAVEKRLLDAGYTRVSKTAAFSPAPDSACFDGLYFWTANSAAGTIVKRMPGDALAEMRTFKYPGQKLAALACDARFLWVADPALKGLVKLSLDDPERILSKTELDVYASRALRITAMASKDGTIWFAGEDGDKGIAFRRNEPK
ncbi:MAG: response regulator [Elusimicrobia bacterium]|nr:response regulator [Elusimicrobiota bacterium]